MLRLWLAISAFVIVADQITKAAIVRNFAFGESTTLTSFFNLILTYNTGAAFSFLADAGGWQRWFFAAVAAVASIVIIYFLRKHANERSFCFALSLILGGALGNLVDRVLLGHVVDFLDFHLAGYHWPAFNVADSAITVGAAILVWESFVGSKSGKVVPNGSH
ncbi:MAG: signal peptidase II [Pseudomonadota bacterium]